MARSEAARQLTLEDYYRSVSASAPAISRDGRWVAFVRNSIVEAENRRHTEIWISPADGLKPAVRLSSATESASAPKWSPDGRLLTFRQGGRDGERGIWFFRMDQPGGAAVQIQGCGGEPNLSPDNS